MGLLKSISKLEFTAAANAAADPKLIELEAKRIRLLFESLKKQGFTEEQAVQIVSGVCAQRSG